MPSHCHKSRADRKSVAFRKCFGTLQLKDVKADLMWKPAAMQRFRCRVFMAGEGGTRIRAIFCKSFWKSKNEKQRESAVVFWKHGMCHVRQLIKGMTAGGADLSQWFQLRQGCWNVQANELGCWGTYDNIESDAKKITGAGWAVSLSLSLTLLI